MSLGRSAGASPGGLTASAVRGAGGRSSEPLPRRSSPAAGFYSVARGALDDLVTTFFPAGCRICDGPLLRVRRTPICDDCLAAPKAQRGALCSTCGEALGFESQRFASGFAATAAPECTLCRRQPPPFTRAVAYGEYAGELRALIGLLKFEGMRAVARPLGAMLAEAIAQLEPMLVRASEPGLETLMAAVPLFRSKTRERGFNQAELLAENALRELRRSHPGLRLRAAHGILTRVKATESQFGLNPRQRRENLRGAFAVPEPARVAGRDVLLVDDIFTTGATARACAAALRRAGARTVLVATVSRAQPEAVALWDCAPGGVRQRFAGRNNDSPEEIA